MALVCERLVCVCVFDVRASFKQQVALVLLYVLFVCVCKSDMYGTRVRVCVWLTIEPVNQQVPLVRLYVLLVCVCKGDTYGTMCVWVWLTLVPVSGYSFYQQGLNWQSSRTRCLLSSVDRCV
jgi:hypothetical protein